MTSKSNAIRTLHVELVKDGDEKKAYCALREYTDNGQSLSCVYDDDSVYGTQHMSFVVYCYNGSKIYHNIQTCSYNRLMGFQIKQAAKVVEKIEKYLTKVQNKEGWIDNNFAWVVIQYAKALGCKEIAFQGKDRVYNLSLVSALDYINRKVEEL